MANYKPAVELQGLNFQKTKVSVIPSTINADSLGVAGDKIVEPVPHYITTPSEKVYEGLNNTAIVLGRDRTGNRLTGYGGRGDTQCGSIDIVAGRMGYLTKEISNTNTKLMVDPNFKLDAARLYISQKTDIDEAFGLASGVVGKSKTKSAIGFKADQIRIIAREGIKLITGTDNRNSQGGKIQSISGIDLIAGNNDGDMQPIPKGKNLVSAIAKLVHHQQKLTSIVDTLLTWQMKLNAALISHYHYSPFHGLPTSPSPALLREGPNVMLNHLQATKVGIMAHKANLVAYSHNYLSPAGQNYINSRWNHTN